MIALSTRTFFKTVRVFIDHHRPTGRRRMKRIADSSAEQVDKMDEHATKRKQPEHQGIGNNASKRQNKKRKLRIHPKEAGHSIEDLPSLTQRAAESDKLSAAEIFESLGLEVSGAGKSAEVWFVGASEQTGDEKMELDVTTEAMGTPAGGSDGGKTMQ